MICKHLSQFYLEIFLVGILSAEIYCVQHRSDFRGINRSSVSPGGVNIFPIGCNVLLVGTGEQVEQITNQTETNVDDLEQVLDLNQTLTATVASQPENTVCYDDLGCITRFSFASPLLWPINLLPEAREKIGTHFTLYTRESPNPQPPIQISADDPAQFLQRHLKRHGWRPWLAQYWL